MKQVTKEEYENYYKKANDWFNNHPEASLYNDVKRIAKTIVTEYIANQNDKTIYKVKVNKVNLYDTLKSDLKLTMKNEILMIKKETNIGTMFEMCVAVKEVVRAVISMFPEIRVKPEKATDDDCISLLKKYVFMEQTRELYLQKILTESIVKDLSAKELSKLTKETISNLENKDMGSFKIGVALSYLPKEATNEEVKQWIGENINFNNYKNRMQVIGPVKQQFKGIDGNRVKKIIMDIA